MAPKDVPLEPQKDDTTSENPANSFLKLSSTQIKDDLEIAYLKKREEIAKNIRSGLQKKKCALDIQYSLLHQYTQTAEFISSLTHQYDLQEFNQEFDLLITLLKNQLQGIQEELQTHFENSQKSIQNFQSEPYVFNTLSERVKMYISSEEYEIILTTHLRYLNLYHTIHLPEFQHIEKQIEGWSNYCNKLLLSHKKVLDIILDDHIKEMRESTLSTLTSISLDLSMLKSEITECKKSLEEKRNSHIIPSIYLITAEDFYNTALTHLINQQMFIRGDIRTIREKNLDELLSKYNSMLTKCFSLRNVVSQYHTTECLHRSTYSSLKQKIDSIPKY
ncbi:MAG: hypothetical protein ACK4NC_02090 [Candidatus Gracilibacteria bacterium]